MSSYPPLILEAIAENEKIKVSIFTRQSTLHQYEKISISLPEIRDLSSDVFKIINKANKLGKLTPQVYADLKKTGQLLYDQLLPVSVKQKLNSPGSECLVISIDEDLAGIPWELLYNGKDFLCLEFSIARSVKTRHSLANINQRDVKLPVKMLVLGDPQNNLNAARKEAQLIRDDLDKARKDIIVAVKLGNIPVKYVKKNLRDYDIVHYAGHAEYNQEWILSDGKFTTEDVMRMSASAGFPWLVFANSCRSAHQQAVKNSEAELLGMAKAFLLSGAK